MIRLLFFVLVLLTLWWIGRGPARPRRRVGRGTRRRVTAPCPYCQARVGFQQIRLNPAETHSICRACLREVHRSPHQA